MSAHLTDLLHTALGASLNGGYQGMVVAGVVLLGLRFFPGINAATRYLVGFGVLLLVVLLPVLHFVVALPDLKAGDSDVVGDEFMAYTVEAGMEPGGGALVGGGLGIVESGESQGGFGLVWGGAGAGLEPELPDAGPLESEGVGEAGEMAPAGWAGLGRRVEWSSTMPAWVGLAFFLTWLGVALIRVIRLCRDYRMLMVLKRRARPVSPEVEASFDLDDGVRPRGRAVAFRLSDEVMIPLAAGFRNPVILFPEGFLDEVKAASVRQVARHEMAHLCRGDDWTNLLQQILKAVFCFLPAVWWVSRRLDMDREIACDDHVLAVTDRLQSYALTLTELAGRGVSSRSVPAPAAWTNKSQLKERIEMILNKRRNASTRTGLVRAGVLTMTTLLFTVAALHLGPRIAFGQDAGGADVGEEVGEEVKTIEREVKLLGGRGEGEEKPVPDRAKITEVRERVVVRSGAEPDATDAPVPARRRGLSSAEERSVERVWETRERRRPGVDLAADVFEGGDGRSSTRRREVRENFPEHENAGRSKGDDAMEERMARLERLVETLVARQGPGQRGGGGYGGGGAEGGGGGFGRGGGGGGGAGGGGGGFGRGGGGGGAGGSGIGGGADFAAQPSLPRRSTRAGAGGRGGVSSGRDLNPGVAARGIGSASPAYGPGSGEHRPGRELRARRDALRAQMEAMNAELKAVERRLHELESGPNHPDDATAPRNPFQR